VQRSDEDRRRRGNQAAPKDAARLFNITSKQTPQLLFNDRKLP